MRVACLFSGGKDSTFAVWAAVHAGWEIDSLITFAPTSPESYMFHHPNTRWTALQAGAMGLRHLLVKTSGEMERELRDLRSTLARLDVDGVVSGALASEYQKERIDFACEELGLRSFTPLWHIDTEAFMLEVAENFETMITSVSAEGLDERWLGRRIDVGCIDDLRRLRETHGISVSGEGGEFETFVLDCPLFSKRIKILSAKERWKGTAGVLEITSARLVAK